MSLVALTLGEQPSYDWGGTFIMVLFPSTLIGGIYGWAEWARRHSRSDLWRYGGLAPLLLFLVPVLYDTGLLDTAFNPSGNGFGALVVSLLGLIGGYGFSKRGPKAARIAAMAITAATTAAFAYGIGIQDAPSHLQPLPVANSVTFLSLMTIYIAASTIPYRPPTAEGRSNTEESFNITVVQR